MARARTVGGAGTVLIVFLLHAAAVSACSCLPPGPPSEELNRSDAVFAGTVEDIREDTTSRVPGSGAAFAVTVDVRQVWKGVEDTAVTVQTARSTAACGYPFQEGDAYLVYADSRNDSSGLTVSLCSRTAGLEHAAEDVDALGTGVSLPPGDQDTAGRNGTDGGPLSGFGAGLLATVAPPLLVLLTLLVLAQLVARRSGRGLAITAGFTTLGGLMGVYAVVSSPDTATLLNGNPLLSIAVLAPFPVGAAALARWYTTRPSR